MGTKKGKHGYHAKNEKFRTSGNEKEYGMEEMNCVEKHMKAKLQTFFENTDGIRTSNSGKMKA